MGVEEEISLTDVVLCYQAMGLSLDDSPAVIERKYRSLTDDYRKKALSLDEAAREEARASQELLNEMFDKIRTSVTYQTAEKEFLKRGGGPGAPVKQVHDVIAQRALMVHCPRCNGLIVKGSEACPICKVTIDSTVKKIARKAFSGTTKALLAILIVLALCAAGLKIFYPEILSGSPDADIFDRK